MYRFFNMIRELLSRGYDFIRYLIESVIEKFFEINIFEKMIVSAVIPAFLAVILPVASHQMFNLKFMVYNPDSHYLIGIVFVMLGTLYFPGKNSAIIRIFLNALYFFNMLYIHSVAGIVKTPYGIEAGYYINLAVPVLFAVFSLLSIVQDR